MRNYQSEEIAQDLKNNHPVQCKQMNSFYFCLDRVSLYISLAVLELTL